MWQGSVWSSWHRCLRILVVSWLSSCCCSFGLRGLERRDGHPRKLEEVPSVHARFPHGFDKVNRTAICLTGQLRSTNYTWTSGHLAATAGFKMFGPDDPPTTAGTIIENLFRPLTRESGIDVFMFLTAHPHANNSDWDGLPEHYEAMVGDMRACEVFSQSDIFQGTGNKFFCLIEPEIRLSNVFVEQLPQWKTYGRPHHLNEQVLAQLYALYRANTAAKEYALSAGVTYEYKIRLRPDIAFVKPFPLMSSLNFGSQPNNPCKATIYFANKIIYKIGNEDWFNVGKTAEMDILLDRYLEFISTPFLHNSQKSRWDLEDNLMGLMAYRHNICLIWHSEIWMVVIRVLYHHLNTWEPEALTNDWKELSA